MDPETAQLAIGALWIVTMALAGALGKNLHGMLVSAHRKLDKLDGTSQRHDERSIDLDRRVTRLEDDARRNPGNNGACA